MTDVTQWSEDDVVAWVRSLGPSFAKHAIKFKANDINGRRLLKLTDDKLEKMGVDSLGIRDDLVEKIAQMNANLPVGSSSSSGDVSTPITPSAPVSHVSTATLPALLSTLNMKMTLLQSEVSSGGDIMGTTTSFVQTVKEILDHPQLPPSAADSRSVIVSLLGNLVTNAKALGANNQDRNAKTQVQQTAVSLIQSVRDVIEPPLVAKPQIGAAAATKQPAPTTAQKPFVGLKPTMGGAATTSAANRPAPVSSFNTAPKSPVSPSSFAANKTPSPIVSPRGPGKIVPSQQFDGLMVSIYNGITNVNTMIKQERSQEEIVEAVVRTMSFVTKLLKETDDANVCLVDRYICREAFAEHSVTAAKEVKSLPSSQLTEAHTKVLKSALLGVSSTLLFFMVKYNGDTRDHFRCGKCQKPLTEDSILCEGKQACDRWFHRSCVGLYSGSFLNTGWQCNIAPCQAATFAKQAEEEEKRKVKEKATREREEEARLIAEDKRRWEQEQQEKKRKEEEENQRRKRKEEEEREAMLRRLQNWDEESTKAGKEIENEEDKAKKETGLTLAQLNEVERWQKKDRLSAAKNSGGGGDDDEIANQLSSLLVAPTPKQKEPEVETPRVVKRLGRGVVEGDDIDVRQSQIIITEDVLMPPQRQKPPPPSDQAPSTANRPMTLIMPNFDAPKPAPAKYEVVCKAKALFDYDPVGTDPCLKFSEGDIIEVTKKEKDSWWEGVVHGQIGYFYSSFVEDLASDSSSSPAAVVASVAAVSAAKKKGTKGHEAPVPKTSVGALGEADFEGWLHQQVESSGILKKIEWKPRWCVLKDFSLYVFENSGADCMASLLVPLPSYSAIAYDEPKREFTFLLDHPSARAYFFSCQSQKDLELWIGSLNRATNAKNWNEDLAKPSPSPSPSALSPPPKSERPTSTGSANEKESKSSKSSSSAEPPLANASSPSSSSPSPVIDATPVIAKPFVPVKPKVPVKKPVEPPAPKRTSTDSNSNSTPTPSRPPAPAPPQAQPQPPPAAAASAPASTATAEAAAVPAGAAAVAAIAAVAAAAAAKEPKRSTPADLEAAPDEEPAAEEKEDANSVHSTEASTSTSSITNSSSSDATAATAGGDAAVVDSPGGIASSSSSASLSSSASHSSMPSLGSKYSSGKKTLPKSKGAQNIKIAPPDIMVRQLPNPVISGYLLKQGGSHKNWKLRWFILKDLCMYYFENNKPSTKALGMIMLPSYTVTPCKIGEVNKSFSFVATHPQARAYYFSADSQEDMNNWIRAMQHACAGQGDIEER